MIGDEELRFSRLFHYLANQSHHVSSSRRFTKYLQRQEFSGKTIQNGNYVESEPEHLDARHIHMPDMIGMLGQQQVIRLPTFRFWHRGLACYRRLRFLRLGLAQDSLDA